MSAKFEISQIDLIRHGETTEPTALCGATDVALSAKGRQQLQKNADKLLSAGPAWDAIYHSPLQRCAEFAVSLGQQQELPTACVDDFREVDFGRWEGLEFDEINRLYPGQWEAWMKQSAGEAPHGGENYCAFKDRVSKAFDKVLSASKGKRSLLVMHGGVARAIMAHTLGLKPDQLFRISIGHACVSRILAYHQKGEPDWYQLDAHNFI